MIQVAIADNFMAGGISIAMRIKPDPAGDGDTIMYAKPTDIGYPSFEVVSMHDAVLTPQPPWLTVDDDIGLALLDALQRHYQGSSDTRALRADYEAERKRVDKLIDTMTDLAARPQVIQLRKAEQ